MSIDEFRFLIVSSEGPTMQVGGERHASNAIDMQDAYGDSDVYYLHDDGKLYPVTVGASIPINMEEENPLPFARSPMFVRLGEFDTICVGYVTWTDH